MIKILNALFGCSHRQTSRVFTILGKGGKRSYVVCLDCGAEFDYCLTAMMIVGDSQYPAVTHRDFVPELKR